MLFVMEGMEAEYWQAGSGWYKLELGVRGQLVPGNAVLPLVPGSAG